MKTVGGKCVCIRHAQGTKVRQRLRYDQVVTVLLCNPRRSPGGWGVAQPNKHTKIFLAGGIGRFSMFHPAQKEAGNLSGSHGMPRFISTMHPYGHLMLNHAGSEARRQLCEFV